MTFRASLGSRLYLHSLSLAAYSRDTSTQAVTDMLETTTLDKTAKTFIPNLESWTASFGGPLDVDTTVGGQYATFVGIKNALVAGTATSYPFTFAPNGADGALILGDAIDTAALDVVAGIGQTVDWSAGLQGTGQLDQNGVVLENATSVTVDGNGTAVDNGAGTTNGAVAHLHVTAFSGLTSDAIIIQQSGTGSFGGEETTLITFTTATGLTSESKTVTGSVGRYLRVKDDVTGTGSITRFVAISRR